MPYFTLHRDYVLRTTKGHSIGFTKGEKTWVPPMCVPDVVAIGAVPVDAAVDVIGDEPVVQAPLTHDEREAKLFAAFETLIARNERGDFGANGLPTTKKLQDMCGFEILNRERDEAWVKFTALKAEQ